MHLKIKRVTTVLLLSCICLALTLAQTNMNKRDILTLTGTIIKQDFVTKKGTKNPDIQDYLLATKTDTLFIKVAEGKFTKKDLEPFVGVMVKVTCTKSQGNLDDNGEYPYMQARGGTYIVLESIEKIQ